MIRLRIFSVSCLCLIRIHPHSCYGMATTQKEMETPPKRRLTSIGVFGESNLGKDIAFIKIANDLGKVLAARNINLVYGGGVRGLKGCAATSAAINGSKVLSVIVKDLTDQHRTYPTVGNEFKVSNFPERMGYMLYSAEAFIALPGGLETLDAVSSIGFWASINIHNKPLGLLNVNGFYDGLLSFLDHAVEQEFISQANRRAVISASTADQLIDLLEVYTPESDQVTKKVDSQASDNGNPDNDKKRKLDTTLRLF